jgi:hypothetical protein
MPAFDAWLATRGPAIATALDAHHDLVCETIAARFADQFAGLCYDASRPDAESFQRQTFRETPRRFHRLVQVALRLQSLAVIEREYRWSWGILPRFGVTSRHMHALVRWYFEAVRALASVLPADRPFLDQFETQILVMIDRAATVEQMRAHQPPRVLQTNGHAVKG